MYDRPKMDKLKSDRPQTPEGLARDGYERAKDILGTDRVHGPDQLRKTFGLKLGIEQAPEIPFSKKQLEQAQEHNGLLIYRPTPEQSGQDLTIQRIMGLLKKEHHLFAFDEDLPEAARKQHLDFFLEDTPTPGWALVRPEALEGTEHLSFEAQRAFIEQDADALAEALRGMAKTWDEARLPNRQRPALPTVEKLLKLRETLPKDIALPKAVDVVFDLLLHYAMTRERLLHRMSVATVSELPELPSIQQPERPVDVGGFTEDGIHLHFRRSLSFGRPDALKGLMPGIPIGYTQQQ